MLKQGDLVEIEINNVISDGEGIGKVNQQTIFVPDTVTGDIISARIVKIKKKVCFWQNSPNYRKFTSSNSPKLYRC